MTRQFHIHGIKRKFKITLEFCVHGMTQKIRVQGMTRTNCGNGIKRKF